MNRDRSDLQLVGRPTIAGRRGVMFGRRRARRRLAPLLLVIGALAAGPAVISLASDTQAGARAAVSSGVVGAGESTAPDGQEGERVAAVGTTASSGGAVALATPPFATFGTLELRAPTATPLLVGFHEASQAEAQALVPHGRLLENANTTRIDPPADAPDGPEYVILSSRGRPPAPTSAVDIVMRDDDPVLSPVDGVVTGVRSYLLYGKYPDHRIEIRPTGHRDVRVVLIHVRDVGVQVGDRVQASTTVLAGSANRFDFGSHIDRYLDPDRWPHVHVEVKRVG